MERGEGGFGPGEGEGLMWYSDLLLDLRRKVRI